MEQPADNRVDDAAFGFLTAIDASGQGVFGGYLVVDMLGRPLEFHCTAPVKVSRAQQILYGPTLPGFLHGRQIGATLLGAGTLQPTVVLTDMESMLQVRSHTPLPVALVTPVEPDVVLGDDGALLVGNARVGPMAAPADRDALIRDRLAALAAAVDLCEPFERIRAAIDEARRH